MTFVDKFPPPELRDTKCSYCYLWTHIMTRGDRIVFCDETCKDRYERNGERDKYGRRKDSIG